MKKLYSFILTLAAFALFALPSFSQSSFTVIEKEPLVDGKPQDKYIKSHFDIQNTSQDSITLALKFQVVKLSGNHMYSHCIGMCAEPMNYDSELAYVIPLAAGDNMKKYIYEKFLTFDIYIQLLSSEFDGDLDEGISELHVIAYDYNNPSDSTSFDIKWVVGGVSAPEEQASAAMSEVFPNPAVSSASVEYNLSDKGAIEVYNGFGVLVNSVKVAGAGIHRFDVSELPSGVYLCKLLSNGAILETKKLVISR